MEALGIGILVTVVAVITAIAAVPLVLSLYGTTTGIVVTGTTAAVYAGAYTYQGSKVIEGMNSYRLVQEGDATGIAVNLIRDTIFVNNPGTILYTRGDQYHGGISGTLHSRKHAGRGSMSCQHGKERDVAVVLCNYGTIESGPYVAKIGQQVTHS